MSSRRAIFLSARREVRERIRSKAFLIATGLQVAIVVAIVVVASLNSGGTDAFKVGTLGSQGQAVAGAAEAEQASFGAELTVTSYEDEAAARTAVDEGEIDAVVADGRLIIGSGPSDTLVALLEQANRDVTGRDALRQAGLDEGQIKNALAPRPLALEELGSESGAGVAFVSSLLLYISLLSFGYMVSGGVVEEKQTRVVEVILSAIRPVHLLAGKVIGIGLLGLGQILVIAGAGLAAALPTGALDLPDSTLSTALLVALYFILGYMVYSCAFAVAGSIVSRQEDAQSTATPITMILVAAYLIGINASNSPDSTLAVISTFVPPLAPMIVPARAAQDSLPLGELVVSVVLMLAAAALLLWIAGRVYNRAALRMGSPLGIRETLKLLR